MHCFEKIKKTEYNTSVALGFFDGVHLGHQAIINACVNTPDCISCVLTFKQSPLTSLQSNNPQLLSTNEEKLSILEDMGVSNVYCIDFSDIKDMSASRFIREILHEKLHAKHIYCGYNYRFGKDGAGDTDFLLSECEKYSITTHVMDKVMYNGDAVSSTRIRACLANGMIEDATAMLNRPYVISSQIINGNHIGTNINTPTINLGLPNNTIVPRLGVYASKVIIDSKTYYGATNVGVHPTVGGNTVLCETHLLNDVCESLYNKHADVYLLHFIRDEVAFDSITSLKKQIASDIITIKKYFDIIKTSRP